MVGVVGNSSRLGEGALAGGENLGRRVGMVPMERAGAIEELEVEGRGCLAVDLWAGSGHGCGLEIVIQHTLRFITYLSMVMHQR